MKRFFVFAALAAFALTSCEQKIDIPAEIPTPGSAGSTGLVFTATTESAATKTALSPDGENFNVVWLNDDQITIVDGATTPNVGVYSTESTTTTATFTLKSGNAAAEQPFKAWYPASIYNNGAPALPATQDYAEGNITGAPMFAGSSTTSLHFKNLGGIICLNLSTSLPDISVASISLSATQPMSGPITNVEALSSETPVAATVSGTAGVTLNCGAGVAISSTSKPFYIAVPAGIYSSLKITVTTTDGKVQTRTSNKGIEVGRSQITNITLGFNTLSATTDLSATESANTYIVSAAGTYRFKATVKGNGGLDPLTGTTATTINPADIAGVKVLWELYNDNEKGISPIYHTIKYDSAYDISYSNGYVTFSTPDSFKEGAACVAIYDNSDNILWSWLIWATAEPGTVTHNGKTFMNKNLGATSRSDYSNNYIRGFLYQWGRKDAFSAAAGSIDDVYWYTPVAADVFTGVTTVESMAYTIAHPTTRIACWTSSTHSWMPEAEYSTKPWQDDVKTIYDPCPPGWKVPTKEDMDKITGLPATGLYSSDGPGLRNFGNAGTGYYWTSTISDDSNLPGNAYAFCNDGRNLNNWSQAEGYAIRPVRE